ncbi:glycosyltransferase [Sandarakinorhabdus sp. DWP1-3-1]|uniref:glycosyltransferase n=1 Tax=Sandarakinorhabdus sp. DWP1-3-1 TaxID=2804627 RepID=UPI003CF8B1A3
MHVVQTIASIAERDGGPARTIRDLCEALARAGARVTLVARHDPARDGALLRPDPALVTTLLVPGRLPDFTAAIRPLGADIVHDNGLWSLANIAAGTAARRLGLPLLLTPHGMLEPWALAWHRRRKQLAWALYQRRLLAQAELLVATAAPEAAAIAALLPGKPVALVPNGVACPPLPDRSDRAAAPGRTLLSLSRLHPKKNLPGLVAAWARLAPQFPDWTLQISGPDEGNHRTALGDQIARLGLGDRVRLTGPVAEADKPALFAAADLFVLPSFSENFGITVTEALAAGVPVVATTGTPWASLATEACGWRAGTDPDSLATALATAMRLSPAERAAMGSRGHALVQRDFGWAPIAARLLDSYGRVMQGAPEPDPMHA